MSNCILLLAHAERRVAWHLRLTARLANFQIVLLTGWVGIEYLDNLFGKIAWIAWLGH
jgi:hypothetical protein